MKLSLEMCRQMARSFPLEPSAAKTLRLFAKPKDVPDGEPWAHSIMTDGRKQVLVMAGRHPYEVMSDVTRRKASTALQGSEYASLGMAPTGNVFALLNDQLVTDPDRLHANQDDCLFGCAFQLNSPLA